MEDVSELLTLLRPRLKYLEASQEVSMDQDLGIAGLDSMGAIDLLLEVEARFNITLPDDLLVDSTFKTPRALWSVICELQR